jgi:hypothetical protein
MATYYWVGGAGTWNNSATTNWASSSGGAGGAGVPTSADNVIFDANSGTGDINEQSTAACNDLTVTATQAIRIGTAFNSLKVYGSLSAVSGASRLDGTQLIFAATTTGKTISTGGKSINSFTFNGVGGGWTLLSNISSGANSCTFTNGTLDTNGYTLNFGTVTYSATGTFNLTLGTSTITGVQYASGWNFATTTGLTFSGTSSTIILGFVFGTMGFFGGGLTYGNLVFNNSSASAIYNITGANTFTGTVSKSSSAACTINLPSSVTTTVANWTVSGSSGNVVTLNSSTAGTQATLAKSGTGLVSVDYLNVKDINANPSNTWYVGRNSTDSGNNTSVYFANAYNISVSEPITVIDSTTQITPVSITELISSVTDIRAVAAAFLPSVFENLVVYDASTTVASFVSSVSEPATLVDSVTSTGLYPTSMVENLALNDAEIGVKIHNASTDEPISVLYVTECFGWGTIDNTESTQWVLIDNRQ